jgi:hypothetical protein
MFQPASGAPWVLAVTLPGFLALPGCMPGQLSLTEAAAEPRSGAELDCDLAAGHVTAATLRLRE